MTTAGAGLVARTVRLDGDVDLLALAGADGVLFRRGGVGFAGRGVALRASRTEVADVLAAITADGDLDRPGTGPVAFGALPFLPGAPCDFVVPSILAARGDDGTRWVKVGS